MKYNTLLDNHKDQGKLIKIADTKAFVYDRGQGVPVVCFHGVPASSFLYRHIIDKLAKNDMRGISFDLLGMGLSDRPLHYDYSWTSLGNWSAQVIKALNLGKFHVILHDIGGPIGCEVISKIPDQILSVTVLNTLLVNLPQFKKPFPMWLFPIKGIGELFLASTNSFLFQKLMHLRGIHKNKAFGKQEANAYLKFLKGDNDGKTFLKIMRGFEPTKAKETLYLNALNNLDVPKQIIWGMNDKGLTFKRYGKPIQEALTIDNVLETGGSHFLQEDYADIITKHLIQLINE